VTRGGREKDRTTTERRCIVTGEVGDTAGLIRFVVGPDDTVVPDVAGKLPGRGIWVTARREALATAVKKNLFSRAARQKVTVPPTLVEDVERRLLAQLTDRLSLARKAGLAVAGREKVLDWLVKEDAVLLLQASDGSAREKSRLRPPPGKGTHFEVLTASELGLSFGREHVIHAALAAGGLTDLVREDALRLSGVRELDGGAPAGKVRQTK
jgi:predicted RNA-binding protein YlxR (DUF448 family)